MKKWMVWVGGVITVLGLIWAMLPHTSHAAIVHAIAGVSVDEVLQSSHTLHRIEGWIAVAIGLVLVWIGWKK
jgi:uncharacterized protein YjeT (DUF2065 family)